MTSVSVTIKSQRSVFWPYEVGILPKLSKTAAGMVFCPVGIPAPTYRVIVQSMGKLRQCGGRTGKMRHLDAAKCGCSA